MIAGGEDAEQLECGAVDGDGVVRTGVVRLDVLHLLRSAAGKDDALGRGLVEEEEDAVLSELAGVGGVLRGGVAGGEGLELRCRQCGEVCFAARGPADEVVLGRRFSAAAGGREGELLAVDG